MSIDGWSEKIANLKAELTALQAEKPFEHVDVPLASALREVIGVKTSRKKAPLGGSKLGGRPHAEPGFVWPTAPNVWQGDELEPLALIAQLDLAELAPHDPFGLLPSAGRLLFFMLPIEYDPMAHRAHVHVVTGDTLVEHAPPRGLRDAGGVFKEQALTFFPTVLFPDPNGGRFQLDGDDERRLKRLLKKYDMRSPDVDSLLDRPMHSAPEFEGFDATTDLILLRFFGEALSEESLWFETEMMLVIGREALAEGRLGEARIVMGEAT